MRSLNRCILFSILTVFNIALAQGQEKPHVYYFDNELKFTTKDSAVFTGMGWNEDNHLKLRCFDVAAKTVVFLAHFTDTTLQVFDGFFQSFYPNGDTENEGNYVKGKMDGLWLRRDEFKFLTDSIIYKDGEKLLAANITYYNNQNPEKKVVNDLQTKKIYNTYYDVSGNKIYSDSISTRPGADSVFITPEVQANFPGDQAAWIPYVNKLAKKNRRALKKDNKEGACNVRFLVDKEGHVSNVKILTMKETALSRVLLDAVTNSPTWEPATENGRAVSSIKEMALTFSIAPDDPFDDGY